MEDSGRPKAWVREKGEEGRRERKRRGEEMR